MCKQFEISEGVSVISSTSIGFVKILKISRGVNVNSYELSSVTDTNIRHKGLTPTDVVAPHPRRWTSAPFLTTKTTENLPPPHLKCCHTELSQLKSHHLFVPASFLLLL